MQKLLFRNSRNRRSLRFEAVGGRRRDYSVCLEAPVSGTHRAVTLCGWVNGLSINAEPIQSLTPPSLQQHQQPAARDWSFKRSSLSLASPDGTCT